MLYIDRFSIGDVAGSYLSEVCAIKHLREFQFTQPVTFFVGENGTGKSTLLEALAVLSGFNPEGGSKNFRFSTKETHSTLCDNMRIARHIPFAQDGFFLRAESFYNVATEVDRLADGDPSFFANYSTTNASLHAQSHGESFLSLFNNRFRGKSLFILDEPEAALSPTRQLALLRRMHDLVNADSQFIIATHSPILMAYPAADIIVITEQGATRTPYQDTEHVVITKRFLSDPDHMLHYLFNEQV